MIPDLACPDFDHAFDRPGIVKPSMNYQLMSNNSYLLKVLQSDIITPPYQVDIGSPIPLTMRFKKEFRNLKLG